MDAARLVRRFRPVEWYVLDVLAAAGAVLISYAGALDAPMDRQPIEPGWLSWVAALAIGLPVAVRRRRPAAVAVIVTVAAAAALGTEIIPTFAAPGPAGALALVFYTVGLSVPARRALLVVAICVVLMSAGMVAPTILAGPAGPPQDAPSTLLSAVFGALIIAPSAILGFAIAERRARHAARGEQDRRAAVLAERLRLARELHDVIAHTMTVIVVKASIGNHVAETDPAEARDALRVIEKTGRAAMAEVRGVLDMLREDAPYAPTPGLDDLPGLVESAAVSDARVTLTVDRAPAAAVSESVQLAVYRIVQEAVTNVVRHAAPAHCRVNVVVGPEQIRVEVDDDGTRPPGGTGSGHGLIGMRERVALHGGTFRAGPRAGGGFSVRALLPVTARERGDV
ncbi:signal transduction histidine kinase [Actinoplanes octamycinicus]|uniref:histidine kinase n=1 Tax=Actinoplanes octamycinicus TaxID=135948 RepID=A0A7W7GZK7_9ACTN|nr:histidine kinase [Actinoplanes octamycinicus]MBB4741245.1 signal transduction histidine kinase [Actinoplanes octamycinicus]GIE56153.1 two-component sensor histidine kinase [Actinoplanes octamycinicus]